MEAGQFMERKGELKLMIDGRKTSSRIKILNTMGSFCQGQTGVDAPAILFPAPVMAPVLKTQSAKM